MQVVGHQAKAQHPHGQPSARGGDEADERLIVAILVGADGPGVATVDDGVTQATDRNAAW